MSQHTLDVFETAPAQAFVPTRESALNRLQSFIGGAGSAYARQRNFDFGPGKHGKVSGLSPWIRHRLLLEEEVVRAVLADHDLQSAV